MTRLEPKAKYFQIPVRKHKPTEFEVQATLYSSLLAKGVDVRGEVSARFPKVHAGRRKRHFRFDLVIYEAGVPKEIIEVKSAPVNHKNGVEATRQGHDYVLFGLPVTFIYGMADVVAYLAEHV